MLIVQVDITNVYDLQPILEPMEMKEYLQVICYPPIADMKTVSESCGTYRTLNLPMSNIASAK